LGANLLLAREDLIEDVPVETLTKMVGALADAGAGHIEISMGMFPWVDEDEAAIGKYDAVVERIRERGMELIISLQYSPAYHACATFAEWREWAITACPLIAERYRPDSLVVISQPSVLSSQLSGLEPAAWASYAGEAAEAVKEASPNTQCAVSVVMDPQDPFQQALTIDGLDAVAFHIYVLRDLRTAAACARVARQEGLAPRLAGSWRPPLGAAGVPALAQWTGAGMGDAGLREIDARWVDAVALAAGVLGLERVTFLGTPAFFAYAETGGDLTDPEYLRRVTDAVGAGERTAALQAFENAVREYGPQTPLPGSPE
jgi:hypothetical protein